MTGWLDGEVEPARSSWAALLDAERDTVTALVTALAADLAEIMAASELVSTDDEHDPDGATIAFERARVSALLSSARQQELEITRAQQRLDHNRYGVCEGCGEPIPPERLQARPTATTCLSCSARQGRRGRAG